MATTVPISRALLADPADAKADAFRALRRGASAARAGHHGLPGPLHEDFLEDWCSTYTERHGLRDLCRDLLGVEISKQQQTSDWGAVELTSEQLAYAASDVLHLHALWARLEALLVREDRLDLALDCFAFLPTRARLDVLGWETPDLFAH